MTRGNWSSFYNDQGGFSGSSVRHGKCGWSSEVSPRRQRNREGVARQRAASFPLFQSREAAKHISPMVTRHGHDEFRTSRCHTVSSRSIVARYLLRVTMRPCGPLSDGYASRPRRVQNEPGRDCTSLST